MLDREQRRLLFLSSVGGLLEFYDFIIYALLANYMAKEFFPLDSAIASLMATFAAFAVGYLIRPIGGIIFGHFGDKYGRRGTFTFSILIMAIATFCIGLVPSYAVIGLWAPALLITFRLLQGISIGGEIPGAIAYVCESMPNKKGFACGMIFFSLLSGLVLGSLIDAILSSVLSADTMFAWGWRIPFFLGGVFGFLSYLLRRNLVESSLFVAIAHKVEAFPLRRVVQQHFVNAFAGIFIVGLGASLITLVFLFTPAYLTKVLGVVSTEYIWYKTAAIFLSAVLCIVFGALSDKVEHKKALILACVLCVAGGYAIFNIYVNNFAYYPIALLLSALLMGLVFGFIPSLLAQMFSTEVRYSGIAVSYNIGFALFAGLSPLVAMVLVDASKILIAPVFCLFASAVLALVGILLVKREALI